MGDEPAGFVLNGFRDINGKRIAWNGGTAIAPTYRGKAIGKKLMLKNLELYREQGVDIATLEALDQNEPAIKLYEHVGYEIMDRLVLLQHECPMSSTLFEQLDHHSYTITKGLPRDVNEISFYQRLSPWQTGWQSMKEGSH